MTLHAANATTRIISYHYLLLIREEVVVWVLMLVTLDLLENICIRSAVKTLLQILHLVPPSRALQAECSPLQTDKQQLQKVGCKHPHNDTVIKNSRTLKTQHINISSTWHICSNEYSKSQDSTQYLTLSVNTRSWDCYHSTGVAW